MQEYDAIKICKKFPNDVSTLPRIANSIHEMQYFKDVKRKQKSTFETKFQITKV